MCLIYTYLPNNVKTSNEDKYNGGANIILGKMIPPLTSI